MVNIYLDTKNSLTVRTEGRRVTIRKVAPNNYEIVGNPRLMEIFGGCETLVTMYEDWMEEERLAKERASLVEEDEPLAAGC